MLTLNVILPSMSQSMDTMKSKVYERDRYSYYHFVTVLYVLPLVFFLKKFQFLTSVPQTQGAPPL